MADQKTVVIISSISGIDAKRCAKRISDYARANRKQCISGFCVEKNFFPRAEDFLKLYRDPPARGWHFSDILGLPYHDLIQICHHGFDRTLELLLGQLKAEKSDLGIITLHPVIFHQLTGEFFTPYSWDKIAQSLTGNKVTVNCVVSIHDDIYDIYHNLLRAGGLYNPQFRDRKPTPGGGGDLRHREAEKDILHLMRILHWRDQELTTSKSMAAALGCRHILFHKKGREATLWRIAGENEPNVYFSHPISQPRRDMTRKNDPEQPDMVPDPERGRRLRDECQDLANSLGQWVPLVEPTCIDELRIDAGSLAGLREQDLEHCFLPPLSERWPTGDGDRLGERPDPFDEENGLSRAPERSYQMMYFRAEFGLGFLASALEILKDEIQRQIMVRDYSLAEQADIVVAFRPFSKPCHTLPSGGVEKEIETMRKKIVAGKARCKPSIIIVHPPYDEIRRRENEIKNYWKDNIRRRIENPDADNVKTLYKECVEIIKKAPIKDINIAEIGKAIGKVIEDNKISFVLTTDPSTMAVDRYSLGDQAANDFVEDFLRNTTILKSALEFQASKLGEYSLYINEDIDPADLSEKISQYLKEMKQ